MGLPIPSEKVDQAIRLIREHPVMLDSGLAELCAVDVKQLKRHVRRNGKGFPMISALSYQRKSSEL